MGTIETAKSSESRVSESIKNYQLKIKNPAARTVRFLILFCALCGFAGNLFAQENFDALAERIARGSDEQKRDALFEIRNIATIEAARLAVSALSDKSEVIRASAAFSVVALPPDESLSVLLPLLKDKKELVRREAAYALGETHNPNAINALVQTIQSDRIGDVKNAAIVALGAIGDASAIAVLSGILQRKAKSDEEFARRSAARSIGQIAQTIQIGKRSVTTPEDFLSERYKTVEKPQYPSLTETFPAFGAAQAILIQILQNRANADDVKREAAFALGAIGEPAAVPVLRANANATDYYLAQICREALSKIAVH